MSDVAGRRRIPLVPTDRLVGGLDGVSKPERSFLGGIRLGRALGGRGYNATWPLVRLSLFPEGLRMESSRRFLAPIVPVWEVRFDEISEVSAVGKIPLFSTGVRLRTKSGAGDWAVFWTVHRPRVLQALADRGLEVERRPVRFHYLNPGR